MTQHPSQEADPMANRFRINAATFTLPKRKKRRVYRVSDSDSGTTTFCAGDRKRDTGEFRRAPRVEEV
jgi:hypothetical protein